MPEYFCYIHNMSDCNISHIYQNASALEVVHISQDFEESWLEHMNCSNEQFICFLHVYQLYMINLLCPQKRCSV